jgi:hypothetical protein
MGYEDRRTHWLVKAPGWADQISTFGLKGGAGAVMLSDRTVLHKKRDGYQR